MYVDFEYYTDVFGGTILTEQNFATAERESEAYIKYLTFVHGDIFADTKHTDAIKAAVCAAAEAYATATAEQSEGGNVKSESKDGLSVSFIVSRNDGETVDDYIKRVMYSVVRVYLLPTGWLNRRVGVVCDYER